MRQRILVILGHPSNTSFCSAIADAYIESAKSAGHDTRILRLGDLNFDPILRHGYKQVQPLEPDLMPNLTYSGPIT
jgi:putative NADPH-quinone reductase